MVKQVKASSGKVTGSLRGRTKKQAATSMSVVELVQPTIQTQMIQQQQSLEVVQIMLHTSCAVLCYLRNLFPQRCFEERDYLAIPAKNEHLSYADFVGKDATSIATPAPGSRPRGQRLKTIARSQHRKADAFLDMLENGVFDALSKRWLASVQFVIHEDKNCPAVALETYTFAFSYADEVDGAGKQLANVNLNIDGMPEAKAATIEVAKRSLDSFARRLITLLNLLPALPHRRYLTTRLSYTPDCPEDWRPAGFRSTEGEIEFPEAEDWELEDQKCGRVASGFHTVDVEVRSLRYTGAVPSNQETAHLLIEQIPAGISALHQPDGSTLVADVERAKEPDLPLPNEKYSSQTRRDILGKHELDNMVRERALTPNSDLPPTQILESGMNITQTQDASAGGAYQTDIESQLSTQGNIQPRYEEQITQIFQPNLSQTKVMQIQARRQNGKTKQSKNGCPCKCQTRSEQDDMFACESCNGMQHYVCYGVVRSDKSRSPDKLVCYHCLLDTDENSTLEKLKTLCILRRAVEVIVRCGHPNTLRDFSEAIGLADTRVIAQITNTLRKEGVIVDTPGSHRKGFSSKGLPRYQLTAKGRDLVDTKYFNPLTYIAHHYRDDLGLQQLYIPSSRKPAEDEIKTKATRKPSDLKRALTNQIPSQATMPPPSSNMRSQSQARRTSALRIRDQQGPQNNFEPERGLSNVLVPGSSQMVDVPSSPTLPPSRAAPSFTSKRGAVADFDEYDFLTKIARIDTNDPMSVISTSSLYDGSEL